ncbi:MAG: hypothetical protein OXC07_09295 [Kistimonas sp.]|nr:hypothetical protein [Kistimonas sp.]
MADTVKKRAIRETGSLKAGSPDKLANCTPPGICRHHFVFDAPSSPCLQVQATTVVHYTQGSSESPSARAWSGSRLGNETAKACIFQTGKSLTRRRLTPTIRYHCRWLTAGWWLIEPPQNVIG